MSNRNEPYYQPPGSGAQCSTIRSARLRERRFALGYEELQEPAMYTRLADKIRKEYLQYEGEDPALARSFALHYAVSHCPITIEEDAPLLGGEDPFFFNLMLPALQADGYARDSVHKPAVDIQAKREARLFFAPCFDGHITPGLSSILTQGIDGIRSRLEEGKARLRVDEAEQPAVGQCRRWYDAALLSCDAVLTYAGRYRRRALELADSAASPQRAAELRAAATVLERVPSKPASTFLEALQSYWIVYCLVTLEIGGCCPGGGLGLGRMDQYLLPYYQTDLTDGVLSRTEALEWIEIFLLQFRHVNYFTPHQKYTPGSQTSLGGVKPDGSDASNALTELIMEASLRIAMPAPYISLRLHREAPERYWQAAANYLIGGLGFPVVNDEVLIPAFLRHGRSLDDARDYICSCCYENTIPGREAFNPNAAYLNLPLVLELAVNRGRTLQENRLLGPDTGELSVFTSFEDLMNSFRAQLHHACGAIIDFVNKADEVHMSQRRYPLMSLFIDECVDKGKDVCEGGARYNLTGAIIAGLPNVVNTLAAIRHVVYEHRSIGGAELFNALASDFAGLDDVRQRLLRSPKWGNGDNSVDPLASEVTEALYGEFSTIKNPRGGRWQVALYSFVSNYSMGEAVGASADGRHAGEMLTRNLNPSWGTDRNGPTAVLGSLSNIDFTKFPNGASLDLRFDPRELVTSEGKQRFIDFLKGFVNLGVMQMQLSMVDTKTLLDAKAHPDRWPNLLVKVAGYSARFVDLSEKEQEEIIERTAQLA